MWRQFGENDKELKKLKNSEQKKEAKKESACKISKDLMSPFSLLIFLLTIKGSLRRVLTFRFLHL